MANLTNFTTPIGRMVMGSLYKPQTKDMDGKPLLIKNGPNAGQPTVKYFFALAIKKGPEPHWRQTDWGAIIWKAGHDLHGAAADFPSFAWKVVDGDSAVPNKRGMAPASREGYPGNWVLSFSSQFAPAIYSQVAPKQWEPYATDGAVKNGYFLQVNGNIDSNYSQTNPGIFLYHSKVAYIAKGDEIITGPDVNEIGFGEGIMPSGALPIGENILESPPNPAIFTMPPPPPTPHVMTAAAKGFTYEQMIASGWTDAQLVQSGMML